MTHTHFFQGSLGKVIHLLSLILMPQTVVKFLYEQFKIAATFLSSLSIISLILYHSSQHCPQNIWKNSPSAILIAIDFSGCQFYLLPYHLQHRWNCRQLFICFRNIASFQGISPSSWRLRRVVPPPPGPYRQQPHNWSDQSESPVLLELVQIQAKPKTNPQPGIKCAEDIRKSLAFL